jgi:hypothetical protein
MYKNLFDVKQGERCSTVHFNPKNDDFIFSEGRHLKIFNKEDLNNFASGVMPLSTISINDMVISAKYNDEGDSII